MSITSLNFDFWNRHPTAVAIDLIGYTLTMRQPDGSFCSGRIVETEAYHHSEGACHAYSFENRTKSDRVAHFFGPAGFSYVYLNYGIHKLFNVITGPDEDGSAVLIRALNPLRGIEHMQANRGNVSRSNLCNGPGKLTQAMSIDLVHNKIDICGRDSPIRIQPVQELQQIEIQHGPRVGISKATDLMWRYIEKGNSCVSKAKENKSLVDFKHEAKPK